MAKATTAPWVGSIRGRVGNIVVVESPHGTVIRSLPERIREKSPLQRASEARVAAASRAFTALSREEGQAWATFGAAEGLSAQQAFNRLAVKLLQIDPQAALPCTPPEAPFFGDGVRVSVSAPSPAPSSLPDATPRRTDLIPRGDEKGILFSASASNAPQVLTELLLQPLASAHRRTYAERYRTQTFVAFDDATREVTVPFPAGWVAAAVRFVEAATGRTTALVEIGVVLVASE